jgi:DNA-binding NarL/FixJ family response regulator
VRVVIAEDSVLMQRGLTVSLADADLDVKAAVGSGDELLLAFGWAKPDVAILGIRMPPTFKDEGARVAEIEDFVDALRRVGREVLGLMAEGRSNQAICRTLFLSRKTVERQVSSIFTKLRLAPAPDDHWRMLAVLAYLRG